MSLRVLILQLLLALAAIPAVIRGVHVRPTAPFVIPPHASTRDAPPLFAADFLPSVRTTFVHAATITELANGDLLAAWYGGYDEIAPDVRIFASTLHGGVWSPPRVIADRAGTAAGLGMRIKSLGNPVLFNDRGCIRLYFVAVVFGGWGGSTICAQSSSDGVHWSPARHLQTSPFLNLGMLVRGEPWSYADGTVALPIYHEMGNKWAGLARVAGNSVLDVGRIDDPRILIQPWVVPTDGDHAIALLRWGAPTPGIVTYAVSNDRGTTWSAVRDTPLQHRDSAVAAVLLDDGSLLAIYNNNVATRRSLAIVRKVGARWSKPFVLENDRAPDDNKVRREYSYPFAIRTHDGNIHVVYTWRRVAIRHIVFNESWAEKELVP